MIPCIQCCILFLLNFCFSLYLSITSLCILSCSYPLILICSFMLSNFPFCVDIWCKVVYILGNYTLSYTLYSFFMGFSEVMSVFMLKCFSNIIDLTLLSYWVIYIICRYIVLLNMSFVTQGKSFWILHSFYI